MNRGNQELIVRLPPLTYAHVLDENDSITRLIVGPQTRTLSTSETMVKPPTNYHVVPENMYCIIDHPHAVVKDPVSGALVPDKDKDGLVKIRFGEFEVRFNVEPFPLYPEEKIRLMKPLVNLKRSEYLILRAVTSYTDMEGDYHQEGERFVWKGPGTFYPTVYTEIVEKKEALTVKMHEGLHCRAESALVDRTGVSRAAGEDYMYTNPGDHFFLPNERLVSVIQPVLLQDKGLHIRVNRRYLDFRDFAKGRERRAGEVFLVTGVECYFFIPHPYDAIIKRVERIVVSSKQFCVVRETNSKSLAYRLLPDGSSAVPEDEIPPEEELGVSIVLTNTSFFLQPWQALVVPPRDRFLLNDNEALLIRATEKHSDEDENNLMVQRQRGDQWLVCGPRSYIPNSFVTIIPDPITKNEKREREVLSEGEGLYVRNTITGAVRAVMGPCSYMLDAYEERWEKKISPNVEMNLMRQFNSHAAYMRDDKPPCLLGKTSRAVVYYIPEQSVTQLFNYKTQKHRVIFGPNRVALEPDEEFTVISLSGSPWDPRTPQKCFPKEPNRITALYLFLGPSNMSDVLYVETRDHAQLALQLCYDWYFDIQHGDEQAASKCFSANDFVGDSCSFIASRIRSAVAGLPFEEFHKNSAFYLKKAVFGIDPATGEIATKLRFKENNLVITSVDTKELEVLDERTRVGLQKSVKIAIELTTQAQERTALQVASTREQEAQGQLDRQSMLDRVESEKQRKILLEAESKGLTIINSGKSKAFAAALATAAALEGNATVSAARVQVQSDAILRDAKSTVENQKKQLELEKKEQMQRLRHDYERAMNDIKQSLVERIVDAIEPQTLAEIAKSAPELQAKLLSSLNLEGYLVTDGTSPVNLYDTATGLCRP